MREPLWTYPGLAAEGVGLTRFRLFSEMFESWALRSSRSVGRHGVADGCAVRLRARGEGIGGAVAAHARYPSRAFDLAPRCAPPPTRNSHRK
ncbi:unnamed protein product, partial [Brenthis ino]